MRYYALKVLGYGHPRSKALRQLGAFFSAIAMAMLAVMPTLTVTVRITARILAVRSQNDNIEGMEIQIDPHTLERAEERGTNEAEIKDVIHTGFAIPAKYGRIGKAKVYDFKQNRHNKYYEHKRVEVFYLIEGDNIITVTVYVFYGKWEV